MHILCLLEVKSKVIEIQLEKISCFLQLFFNYTLYVGSVSSFSIADRICTTAEIVNIFLKCQLCTNIMFKVVVGMKRMCLKPQQNRNCSLTLKFIYTVYNSDFSSLCASNNWQKLQCYVKYSLAQGYCSLRQIILLVYFFFNSG